MKNSHPQSNFQKETSCVPTCCAKLELGSLFCTTCRKFSLPQLATAGLESEEIELLPPSQQSYKFQAAGLSREPWSAGTALRGRLLLHAS